MLVRSGRLVVLVNGTQVHAPPHLPLFDLDRYCERHDLRVERVRVAPETGPTGGALLSAAMAQNVDLLVLGAFGNSRLREWALGGVSRHMLGHSPIPLLIRHCGGRAASAQARLIRTYPGADVFDFRVEGIANQPGGDPNNCGRCNPRDITGPARTTTTYATMIRKYMFTARPLPILVQVLHRDPRRSALTSIKAIARWIAAAGGPAANVCISQGAAWRAQRAPDFRVRVPASPVRA